MKKLEVTMHPNASDNLWRTTVFVKIIFTPVTESLFFYHDSYTVSHAHVTLTGTHTHTLSLSLLLIRTHYTHTHTHKHTHTYTLTHTHTQ